MKQKLIFLSVLFAASIVFFAEYFVDASRPDDSGSATNWAAAEEGMPYQTLIASIVHKYASGALIDRRSLVVSEAPAPYKTRSAKKKK